MIFVRRDRSDDLRLAESARVRCRRASYERIEILARTVVHGFPILIIEVLVYLLIFAIPTDGAWYSSEARARSQ